MSEGKGCGEARCALVNCPTDGAEVIRGGGRDPCTAARRDIAYALLPATTVNAASRPPSSVVPYLKAGRV